MAAGETYTVPVNSEIRWTGREWLRECQLFQVQSEKYTKDWYSSWTQISDNKDIGIEGDVVFIICLNRSRSTIRAYWLKNIQLIPKEKRFAKY